VVILVVVLMNVSAKKSKSPAEGKGASV
jgi:hypothetical protein